MNILVIDNQTRRLQELYALFAGHNVDYRTYADVSMDEANEADLVVLTGGSGFPIVGNEDKLENEIRIIQNTSTPILGICFGFELIHVAFGGVLAYHDSPVHGLRDISFQNGESAEVYEYHRWLVKKARPDFLELAHSETGVEVMRHKTKNIIGTQFHPEMMPDSTYGLKFFQTVVDDLIHESIQ